MVLNNQVIYRRPRQFTVRAKPYPQDSYVPPARVEEYGMGISPNMPRAWTFFIWDESAGDWDNSVNFAGSLNVDRSKSIHLPQYDTWDVNVADQQQQAFVDGIDRLADGAVIVIVASHAAENYTADMVARIKYCGGSTAKLNWTTRSSYILVGRVGLGEGNGYHEVLDNVTLNGVSNCAELTFSW